MKNLPYYRWYPADAIGDEKYSSLNDTELGFYHRCLNSAWINNGLPANLNELAAAMRVTRKRLDQLWPKVSRCWTEQDGRLYNRRQEEEREHATTKSENNRRPGNANARKSEPDENANETRTRFNRDAIGSQHARVRADSDSDSVCVSESQVKIPEKQKTPIPFPNGSRFLEWINGYQGRKADEDSACRAWISVGADSQAEAAFACRDRYNGSREVAEGKCMEAANFIFQQSRNGWKGDWPKARDPTTFRRKSTAESMLDRASELWKEAEARGEL